MKIKLLPAISVVMSLACAAIGQGAAGTGGAGGTTGTAPGNSGVTPGTTPGVPSTANPATQPPLNPNGNTPVVGGGIGVNNMNMASNNLAIGSNQFAIRTNSFGNTHSLTPTGQTNGFNGTMIGTNGNAILIPH